MASISMDTMILMTSWHTISPSQSPMMQPHFINLNQFEMSIVHCMRQDPSGKWSCELCDAQFNDIIILATHLLTSCDHDCDDDSSSPTFSNKSAVDICMLLDEAKSIKMFESYVSVANEESDIEDCDLEDDTHSEASGPRYTDHEEDNEVGIEDEEDKGPVWWVSEEDESNESVDEDTTFEKQDKDLKRGSAATKGVRSKNVKRRSAVAKTVRMPRNQEFPALPPHSLSPDAKSEWTFRRDRAGEIRDIMKTNLQTNSRKVDQAAALAAWNASAHPSKWRPNASSIPPYKSFGVLKNRWSLDRTRLRELTAEAEDTEEAEEAQGQQ